MNNKESTPSNNILWAFKVPEHQYALAHRLFVQEKYKECIHVLNNIIDNLSKDHRSEEGIAVRKVVILHAWSLYYLGSYEQCKCFFNNAIAQCLLTQNDPDIHIIDLWIQIREGHYDKVLDATNNSIRELAEHLHPHLAEHLFLRGFAKNYLGDQMGSLEDCESAYALFKIMGKLREQAELCNFLGILCCNSSNYSSSIKWFKESLASNTQLKLTRRIASNRLNLGIARYKCADYIQAIVDITKAKEKQKHSVLPAFQCRANIAHGNVCRLIKKYEEARKHLTAAYTLATAEHLRREECLALEFLGDVFRDEGKPEEARRYYARGMAIAQDIAPEGDLVMELMRREGECLGLLGDHAQAMSILAKARTLSEKLGDRFEEGIILRCLAVSLASARDWSTAERYLQKSIRILEDIDAKHECAISNLVAARIMTAQADDPKRTYAAAVAFNDAWHYAIDAQHLFFKLGIDCWIEESRKTIQQIGKRKALSEDLQNEDKRVYVSGKRAVRIIAKSSAMKQVLQMSGAFAKFNEAVLITGETGTGKELIARRIYDLSKRSGKSFVPVNVAAIPHTMFEREFFGHHRGAFSGADKDSPGYAALAHGGTLFLDEIADCPVALQPKLLRLLQEGSYTSLGNPREKRADVRLIAATNQNLSKIVEDGLFRQDLYYRIRVLEINIPPLRERKDDIIPLLEHFLQQIAGQGSVVSQYFNDESIQALMRFPWHGNVREIAVAARRAHIGMAIEGRVRFQLGMAPNIILVTGPEDIIESSGSQSPADDMLRSRIIVALEEAKGNKSEAARHLAVSRPTLYRWMKRLRIKA